MYQEDQNNVVVFHHAPHDRNPDIAEAGMGDPNLFIVTSAVVPGLIELLIASQRGD